MNSTTRPWRSMPAREGTPELYAFNAPNGADGICRIERNALPDRRTLVIVEEVVGNPGMSVTNAIEAIAAQLSQALDIPPGKMVIVEHYERRWEEPGTDHWDLVTFNQGGAPTWTPLDAAAWKSFGFRPRARNPVEEVQSLIVKDDEDR